MPKSLQLSLGLVGVLLLAGCNSVSGRVDNGTGRLEIFLTDAPIDLSNVQSVNVTLTGVIIYPEEASGDLMGMDGEGGVPLSLTTHPATFDLLTLTGGASALLASDEVPAGDYSRIRLEISDATLLYQDATSTPLKIDSNKVDVPIRFHVTKDAGNVLVLDFDAAASVQVNETGSDQFILRPVVTPVP
jgi:hypothetical protein